MYLPGRRWEGNMFFDHFWRDCTVSSAFFRIWNFCQHLKMHIIMTPETTIFSFRPFPARTKVYSKSLETDSRFLHNSTKFCRISLISSLMKRYWKNLHFVTNIFLKKWRIQVKKWRWNFTTSLLLACMAQKGMSGVR